MSGEFVSPPPPTPLCEHWGHESGEWKYSCCVCSGAPGGCVHCHVDIFTGRIVHPDGVCDCPNEWRP